MTNYEIGDWVKIEKEEDYYNIKSIDLDSGYIQIQDVGGHSWYTALSTVERKCSNKEIYGATEKTTADEFNKDEYSKFGDDEEDEDISVGASIVKSNKEVSGIFMVKGEVKHIDYIKKGEQEWKE